MDIHSLSKIQNLITKWPKNTVALTSFLNTEYGISNALISQYKKSQWILSIGQGAYVKRGEKVNYKGALFALQNQGGLSVHAGGKTALSLLGLTHFVQMNQKQVMLFHYTNEVLPKWFKNYQWEVKLEVHQSAFLPDKMGLTYLMVGDFSISISDRIRALMEVLLLANTKEDLIEAYEILEKFYELDPKAVQDLLENCTSVKVNRSFLFMAKKAKHKWYEKLNLNKIDLGKGQRSLVKNGVYDQEFQIMIPKELKEDHDRKFL